MSAGGVPIEALEPLVRNPAAAGIFMDFDGTLSEIVSDPDEAIPLDGAVEVLDELASIYGRVGILSGRPVSFLEQFFPHSVLLAGIYGLETLYGGERRDHPLGGAWREVIDDVAAIARARGPAGMKVESKGLSLTLHYRTRPRLAPKVRAFAEQQALRSGLECRPARMSYELHPPIPADKGTALLELAEGLEAVCFIGDDLGDLHAFDALDTLAEEGQYTLRIAVHSNEEATELIDRADAVVDSPKAVLELAEYLRDSARR
ncbi:trehalose-phosphatase [Rhabdothermincola sp.]|uniref:trehalose-phosphatase n=1 Tax=Rhabdothermincola sp. TaxID=2820405 RepID=UPI002FDFB9C5